MISSFDYMLMNKNRVYRVPDVIDILYNDVVYGLYSPIRNNTKFSRILIAKCNLACEFLLNSTSTENEIAVKLDFKNVKDLRASFECFLGINPSDFRQRFKDV